MLGQPEKGVKRESGLLSGNAAQYNRQTYF